MRERWYDLLCAAVAAHSRGRTGVAEDLGLSRSAISQVLSGSYPASTEHIARRVLEQYDRFRCPHLGSDITPVRCAQYSLRQCPTTSPAEVRHWRACQGCAHRPKEITA